MFISSTGFHVHPHRAPPRSPPRPSPRRRQPRRVLHPGDRRPDAPRPLPARRGRQGPRARRHLARRLRTRALRRVDQPAHAPSRGCRVALPRRGRAVAPREPLGVGGGGEARVESTRARPIPSISSWATESISSPRMPAGTRRASRSSSCRVASPYSPTIASGLRSSRGQGGRPCSRRRSPPPISTNLAEVARPILADHELPRRVGYSPASAGLVAHPGDAPRAPDDLRAYPGLRNALGQRRRRRRGSSAALLFRRSPPCVTPFIDHTALFTSASSR